MMKAIVFKRNLIIASTILLVGVLSVPSNGSTNLDLDSGLVGYWSFDEASGNIAHDYSGYGNHGAIYGASWTSGISGSALSFDGQHDYVLIPDSDILDITGDITMLTWVYPHSMPFVSPFLSKGTDSDNYGYYLATGTMYSSRADLQLQSAGGNTVQLDSKRPLAVGQWYQVVGVRENGTARIYINGALDTTEYCFTEPIRTNDLGLYLGAHYVTSVLFHGIMDEVRIYNRALSDAEIESLYCRNKPRGDANGDCVINLGDVVYLITYLYKNGPAPDCLLTGDANCSGVVELGDVVYLITYLYKAGPPPSCK